MKKLLLLALFLGGLLSFSNAQTRSLDKFSSIRVCGGIKVNLTQGSIPSAKIEMIQGDIDDLVLMVKGDQLVIEFKSKKNGFWGPKSRKATIDLTYTVLDEISACAGANVLSDKVIKANDFDADASSGASIKIGLDADNIDVDVSSGANITLRGNVGSIDVEASSGASYHGLELSAEEVNVDVSSGASAKVWATKSLDAEASSGGSVRYKGNPSDLDLDVGKYSGGSIRKI